MDHRKAQNDNTVLHAINNNGFIGSKHIQEWPHKENTEDHEQQSMKDIQEDSLGGGS